MRSGLQLELVLSVLACLAILTGASTCHAQRKQLPPAGIEIDSAKQAALVKRTELLGRQLENALARTQDGASAQADAWGVHVRVLLRAVELAVQQNLFFKSGQVDQAGQLLDEAERRIVAGEAGERGLELLGFDASANDKPQPLVGGFVSRIDDSVQPFGLVLPVGYLLERSGQPIRMDVWLHGRGDTKTEIPFLVERMTKPGQYAPAETVVLHPFGRHCNAFKFAGETDVDEAISAAELLVLVDGRRLSVRGFSMGGAGCWHLAVHDPTRWMSANPGAGFVDTIRYQGWSEEMPFPLTPAARKLLNWYDVLPWAENVGLTKVIAYSGEKDKQKMAADRVVARADSLGIKFPYVIGKDMGHKIDPASQQIISAQIDDWAEKGRVTPRQEIDFVTYTLRYARADWIRVTGLQEHWTESRVRARIEGPDPSIHIETSGVTSLEIDFSESGWPGRRAEVAVNLDGQDYTVSDIGNTPGFQCRLMRDSEGQWMLDGRDSTVVRKRPGLQGPIDDAFCDRFVLVVPSRPARHGRVQRWIDREIAYFKSRWERLMRGRVTVVVDSELTEDQIQTCHLVCFGDYSSNRFLFKVASELPVRWSRETLQMGEGQEFDAGKHVPVFCLPNPLNPERYLVVNSGMTFRDFSNTSNSRQIAMLPDWAVLDVTAKDDLIYAGSVASQGFFNESWEWQPPGETDIATE